MTGQLTLVPMRAVHRASKSPSKGEAELQTPLTQPNVRNLPSFFQFLGVILDLPTHPKMILITWQLTMTGQLTLVPMRAVQRASKSPSRGEAELQMGMRLWVRPGNFVALRSSITSWRLIISVTSISLSFLATSITLILPPPSSALFLRTAANSASSALTLVPKFC